MMSTPIIRSPGRISNVGRHRLQVDGAVKTGILEGPFLSFTLYNTFDNRPPTRNTDRNDIGVMASIGSSH